MNATLLRTVSTASLALAACGSAVSLLAGSPYVAAGLAAGLALGLLPIASWAVLAPAMLSTRGPWLFAAATLGKLIVYGGALYALIFQDRVHPMAFGLSLLAPSWILAIAATRMTRSARIRP